MYMQQPSRAYPQAYPYTPVEPPYAQTQQFSQYQYLQAPVLQVVTPWVQYGLKEAQYTSVAHAMQEVAAISYLIGQGYTPTLAHYIVEAWEKGPGY